MVWTSKKIYTPEEYTGTNTLVHLHNHTIFSMLDGVATPIQYADECYKRGYPAMSATEHGNMASVPDMYTAFKKYGIKYIPGYEGYYNEHHGELVSRQSTPETAKISSARYCNASDDKNDHRMYLRLRRSRHLTLLAKNQEGFSNLIKLSTDVHSWGWHAQRGRSRFGLEELKKYKEGLIVLSGCLNGPISHALKRRDAKLVVEQHSKSERRRIQEGGDLLGKTKKESWIGPDGIGYEISKAGANNRERAANIMKDFLDVFGEDYYIELQMPVIVDEDKESIFHSDFNGLIDLLPFRESIELADDLKIKCVLTNDIHYMQRKDHELQRLMMAIDQKVTINSPDLWASNSSEQYMKTRAELWCTFMNNPYNVGIPGSIFHTMCDNSLEIADKCQTFKPDQSPKIPKWPVQPDDALREAVYSQLRNIDYWDNTEKFEIDGKLVTYREQADIELERFISKGFSSYFLITSDLVSWGRSQGYPFSPRGSAGGSLVCMLLGIHTLNPMKWGLSFDRFMSPSRGGYMLNLSMPKSIN